MDEPARDEPVNEMESDLQEIQLRLQKLNRDLRARARVDGSEGEGADDGIASGNPVDMNPLTADTAES